MDTPSLWSIILPLLTAMAAIVVLVMHLLQVRKRNQMALYDHFRRNVHALVDAMDTGGVHPSLLFESRDQFWQIERKAPGDVAMAATKVVELLKPAIDRGPTDEFFSLVRRALDHFENACRTDAGLDTVPGAESETAQRARRTSQRTAPTAEQQHSPDTRPDSDIQDQLDHEAALSQVFPEGASATVESSLKGSAPHRSGYSEQAQRKRKEAR